MAKFSFVVPFFKKEKYLKKCIESLLGQDYTDIEVVVSFDGVSDEGMGIVSSFTDERLKSVILEHGGACKARNEGFKATTGEYVCFWDADCYAEPGMVRVWSMIYEKNTDIGFIYSGYKWADDVHQPYPSEDFNPWKLTCNNYICSMSVMKREIFPGWDESLKSLQDWDLFLTIVEKGHKGYFNKGFAFTTEFPEEGSISYENCKEDVWLARKESVRSKHGIKDRNICLSSYYHTYKGYDLAQMLGGDFDVMPSYKKNDYKMIYKLGFYAAEQGNATAVFKNAPKECIKVIQWFGKDIESLMDVSYRGIKILFNLLNEKIDYNFCETEVVASKLKFMGLKDPKVVLLPVDYKDVEFPKEFSICYDYDVASMSFVKSIENAMPDIKFYNAGIDGVKIEDVSCFLGIYGEYPPLENFKKFITAGRFVITNFQLPYSNYQDEYQKNDMAKYKVKIVEKIREIQKKYEAGERNTRAMEFWRGKLNKDTYISKIKSLTKVVG